MGTTTVMLVTSWYWRPIIGHIKLIAVFGCWWDCWTLLEVDISAELGVEVNNRCRSPHLRPKLLRCRSYSCRISMAPMRVSKPVTAIEFECGLILYSFLIKNFTVCKRWDCPERYKLLKDRFYIILISTKIWNAKRDEISHFFHWLR